MYAVIFTAKIKETDAEYRVVADRMSALAAEKYGCVDFESVSEGDREIAISYWPSLKHIVHWKGDPEHIKAQALG
jgi:heme-degrading monooxygenase HmoA